MKLLVLKAIMPVAAFTLASVGAVSTNGLPSKSKAADIQGWHRIAPKVCDVVRLCNNLGTVICNDGINPMYAKVTPTSDCTLLLTHRN
jgi:hypothetical protein